MKTINLLMDKDMNRHWDTGIWKRCCAPMPKSQIECECGNYDGYMPDKDVSSVMIFYMAVDQNNCATWIYPNDTDYQEDTCQSDEQDFCDALSLHKTFKPGLYQAEVFKRRYGDEVSFDVDIFPKYILSL